MARPVNPAPTQRVTLLSYIFFVHKVIQITVRHSLQKINILITIFFFKNLFAILRTSMCLSYVTYIYMFVYQDVVIKQYYKYCIQCWNFYNTFISTIHLPAYPSRHMNCIELLLRNSFTFWKITNVLFSIFYKKAFRLIKSLSLYNVKNLNYLGKIQ